MRLPTRTLLAPAIAAGLLAAAAPSATATTATATAATPASATSPSTPAAKVESVVTLTAKPLWSGTGEKLSFVGEVYRGDTYRPLSGRPIVLQTRVKGTTTWWTAARLESNGNGAFTHTRRADRSRDYRAVYSGNAWFDSDQSSWERQTATSGAKVRTSAKLYVRGSSGSTVRGRLTALWSSTIRPLRGANVTIQARQPYGTYWFDAGRAVTDSTGYYSWSTAVRPNQCYRYRVIYKGNSTWAAKSTETYWGSCS